MNNIGCAFSKHLYFHMSIFLRFFTIVHCLWPNCHFHRFTADNCEVPLPHHQLCAYKINTLLCYWCIFRWTGISSCWHRLLAFYLAPGPTSGIHSLSTGTGLHGMTFASLCTPEWPQRFTLFWRPAATHFPALWSNKAPSGSTTLAIRIWRLINTTRPSINSKEV